MPESLKSRRLTYDAYGNPVDWTCMGFPVGILFPPQCLELRGGQKVVYHRRVMCRDPNKTDILVSGVLVTEEKGSPKRKRITIDEVVDPELQREVTESLSSQGIGFDYIGFDPVIHNLISKHLSRKKQNRQI